MKLTFVIKVKTCPLCKILKNVDEFDHYFSNERQKFRLQSYCKICSKPEKTRRSKEYYQLNKSKRIDYAINYKKRPENIDKNRQQEIESKRRRRKNLANSYVRDLMVQQFKFKNKDLLDNPDIVNFYRNKLLLTRIIKKIKNGKK